jgi:hypothetical protein
MSFNFANQIKIGERVSARLTANPDYFSFSAQSAGQLNLFFDSPLNFTWKEYRLTILKNDKVIGEPIDIEADRTIVADLPEEGLYVIKVEAYDLNYALPDADYSILANTFTKLKPSVSIEAIDTLINEGTPSKLGAKEYTSFRFKISLSEALATDETVRYTISGLSDSIDINDFNPTSPLSGTTIGSEKSVSLEFKKGQTEKTITIDVAKDSVEEANEEFAVMLFNPSSGIQLNNLKLFAKSIILNDEYFSTATITNITAGGVLEGTGSGLTTHSFEINLDKPTLTEQTLDYSIILVAEGADKFDFGLQTPINTTKKITIPKGASKATVLVSVKQDSIAEPIESYMVRLSNPSSQIKLGVAQAQSLIVNDDKPSELKWSEETTSDAVEGKKITYSVSLDKAAETNQTINWSIQPHTDLNLKSTAGADFKKTSGSFTITKGKTEASFTIETVDDKIVEEDEYFKIVLDNPTGGLFIDPNGYQKLTLLNDNDLLSTVTIAAPAATFEGGDGKKTDLTFKITLDNAPATAQTVNWHVSTIDSLTENDFVGNKYPSGTLTIPAKSKTANITFSVQGDTVAESNETAYLVLRPDNASTSTLILDPRDKNYGLQRFEVLNDDGIVGTKNADFLKGTDLFDFILGLDGADTIESTQGGDDYIYAGPGNDNISTSSNNYVYADSGNDLVAIKSYTTRTIGDFNGGDGIDTLETFYNTINILDGTFGGSNMVFGTFKNFEKYNIQGGLVNVVGSDKNEVFYLNAVQTVISGGGGKDEFFIPQDKFGIQINDLGLDDKINMGLKVKLKVVPELTGSKGEINISYNNPNETVFEIDLDGNKDLEFAVFLVGIFTPEELLKIIS